MSEQVPSPRLEAGQARLVAASAQLRANNTERALVVAGDVFDDVLRAGRRSLPVPAFPPFVGVSVASHVLTSLVRSSVDAELTNAVVGRVHFDTGERGAQLVRVRVEIIVKFGERFLDVADRARELTVRVLAEVLGGGSPSDVLVVPHDVHIGDVTKEDPHLVDPRDE